MYKQHHVDKVLGTIQSSSAGARSSLAASWVRSVKRHGLDPALSHAPHRLCQKDVHDRVASLDHFMQVASPKLDALFELVSSSGCGVLLSDRNGIIIDRRCASSDMTAFSDWGLEIGADWSEAREGTNGIGTCLTEKRQITIHRDEHFLARNIGMSCMDAPIFGTDGQVIAALDVSSARADQTASYNRLISAMVAQTARSIEAEHFRASFPKARIVVADMDDSSSSVLVAVNGDDLLVGATRAARKVFGLEQHGAIKPRPAADLFGRDDGPTGFEKAEKAAMVRALARADGNVSEAARALGVGRATLYRRMKRLGVGESLN